MLIYAKQPIYYLINNYPQMIKTLFLAKEVEKKEYSRLMKMGFEVKRIPNEAAQKMCKNASHQGFLAEVSDYKPYTYQLFLSKKFVLVLSGLTDIGNIGAIVRSAYALGVDAIIACGVKQLPFDGIVRSSTGALFDIPFAIEQNVHDVLNKLVLKGKHASIRTFRKIEKEIITFIKVKFLVSFLIQKYKLLYAIHFY